MNRVEAFYRRTRAPRPLPRRGGSSIDGEEPRPFRCHYCPETWSKEEAEAAFIHLFTHPEADRRRMAVPVAVERRNPPREQ